MYRAASARLVTAARRIAQTTTRNSTYRISRQENSPTFHSPAITMDTIAYSSPPEALARMALAQKPPELMISPCRKFAILREVPSLPSIVEVAADDVKLAGLRCVADSDRAVGLGDDCNGCISSGWYGADH